MFDIYTAIVTPFKEDLTIDYLNFKRLILRLLDDGVSGIVVGGTTGEAPTLSFKEKRKLYEFASILIDKKCRLIFGVGTNDTKTTIDFLEYIKDIECDGYLVVVPYYSKPSQNGLEAHFREVAYHTNRDIWLYNIPGRTGVSLSFETIKNLSMVENIKGIKEASCNFDLMERIKKETNLLLYIGEDYLIYEAYKRGFDGVISVASHLFTKEIRKIIDDEEELEFNQYRVRFQVLFYEPNPVMIKALLGKLGIIKPYVRLPHVTLDENLVDKYYKIIIEDEKKS